MQKTNYARTTAITAPSQYINGDASIKTLIENTNIECHVSEVKFGIKGRTHWHTHPYTQILIGKSGKGFVQKQGEKIIQILPGDTIVIFANEIHWHGAGIDDTFSHIVIQMIKAMLSNL